MKILALDLGKFKSVSCLFDTEHNTTVFWTFSTDRDYLSLVVRQYQPELVVLEACSISGWVHDACVALGVRVLVCNPNQEAWRWKNVKRKTDRDEALKLAKLAALGQLVPVHVPAPTVREHRSLVKHRKQVVRRLTRVRNTIRALFQQHGLPLPAGHRCWTIEHLAVLQEQAQVLSDCQADELWRGQLGCELADHQHLQGQLDTLETALAALAERNERIQLLTSIPGLGRVTAEIIVTQLDCPERFRSSREVSSYAGLVPRQFQSGQMDRQGSITRRGSRLLRSALVECAWLMVRYNAWAKEQFTRLCHGQKTRRKKAITALARKILVRCWAMLRTNRPWSPNTMKDNDPHHTQAACRSIADRPAKDGLPSTDQNYAA